jgi:GrpB-like predicted nucleotidyltransferase (UPF0157 family)
MKSAATVQSLSEECFVLQMDGKAKSQHRRFVDALRAGLQLRDQYPEHKIKVQATQESGEGTAAPLSLQG